MFYYVIGTLSNVYLMYCHDKQTG